MSDERPEEQADENPDAPANEVVEPTPSPDDPFGLGLDDLLAEAAGEAGSDGSPDDGALLEKVTAERDEYLDLARRVQADFENYKRRVEAQRAETIARAAEELVLELLPVLDACDAALDHGAEDVAPIRSALVAALERKGLERIDPRDADFDPERHEAVMQEPGEGGENGPVVAEVLRAGYQWNGRVIRPAMVKVRG